MKVKLSHNLSFISAGDDSDFEPEEKKKKRLRKKRLSTKSESSSSSKFNLLNVSGCLAKTGFRQNNGGG